MIVAVEVGVALARPPKVDRLSRIIVDVPFDPVTDSWWAAEQEARLTACWIADSHPEVVMPVEARVVDILEV